jgi:hypothetical protein
MNHNPFSLTALEQDVVNEINTLAIEYNSNCPRQSPGDLAPLEYIEKKLAKYPARCYYVVG